MNDPKIITPSAALTRRSFLRTSSKALAAGAIVGALPVERFALGASPGDTLRIALVGCGGRGSGAADQALSTSGGVKLVAMADVFKDRMEQSLKEIGAKHKEKVEVSDDNKFIGFDAYKKAIASADVVILATPPGFRPMQFEEAVRQGKHIFMEKPVATDAPAAPRALAAAEKAKKKNLKVAAGLQRHHQQGYIETIQRLHDGAIGDITSMNCYWNGSRPWQKKRADLEKQYGRK